MREIKGKIKENKGKIGKIKEMGINIANFWKRVVGRILNL
jgi:hypothetical protein